MTAGLAALRSELDCDGAPANLPWFTRERTARKRYHCANCLTPVEPGRAGPGPDGAGPGRAPGPPVRGREKDKRVPRQRRAPGWFPGCTLARQSRPGGPGTRGHDRREREVLTVSILINGRPLYTRSVVNRLAELGGYVCDDGTLIEHDPADGAIALAIKALGTIREVPPRHRNERRCP